LRKFHFHKLEFVLSKKKKKEDWGHGLDGRVLLSAGA
jgi:hypothetical protein